MVHVTLIAIYLTVIVAIFVVAFTTLAWMVDSWRSPEAKASTAFPVPDEPRLSFSLLVPARHEHEVLAATVGRLCEQDHPNFEILVIVSEDDPETAAVARMLERAHDVVRVVIDENEVKSKPRALNTALPLCSKEIIGVFDAEDDVAPALLRHIDATFRQSRAHIVQGGVQLMNFDSSWWSVRNVLEYFFWFSSRLHFHARLGFIPLGGNTVFVRADLLRKANGWDPECLAEDCELGVRLSSWGARTAVAFGAALATREETPPSARSFFKQRTRWSQGFLQVLRKGEWRRLPTAGQRLMAVYILSMPFAQAFAGVLIPISLVTMLVVKAPALVVLVTYVPLLPTIATMAIEVLALREFRREFAVPVRLRHYLILIAGTVPYQLMLAAAALRATARELRGSRGWEKTEHRNAHRPAALEVEEARS
ncbi:MAG: glycosyl transferase [Pseudonocardiales bacterium]|nr:glycosyl transferase, family 2 [Jatrophihabitantaceae bacterium]MCW2605111.1 glycosyl transferase [Pseudonocardiales bacterium]